MQIQSELYTRQLPVAGKGDASQETTLVDIMDLETGEESTLICSALIISALEKARGAKSVKVDNAAGGDPVVEVQYESDLTGRYFAMRAGEIRAGKRYRDIEVIELKPAE